VASAAVVALVAEALVAAAVLAAMSFEVEAEVLEESVDAVVVGELMQDVKRDVLAEETWEAWKFFALPCTPVAIGEVAGVVVLVQNIGKSGLAVEFGAVAEDVQAFQEVGI
jgi:hypothetical protein